VGAVAPALTPISLEVGVGLERFPSALLFGYARFVAAPPITRPVIELGDLTRRRTGPETRL
jgi:hypothetical protein